MKFTTALIHKKHGMEKDPIICGFEKTVALCLKQHNVKLLSQTKALTEADEETLIVVIGGDGTMLTAARLAGTTGAHILGFNMGHLGFLTEFSPDQIPTIINDVMNNTNVRVEQRSMLEFFKYDDKKQAWTHGGYAVNDVVISNCFSDSVIKYRMHIEETGHSHDNAGKHTSNGIIIATPTGSTAYSLNVGGSILAPTLDVMQIVPIAAMGMTTRPIVVGGRATVLIDVKAGSSLSIKYDGLTNYQCAEILDQNTKILVKQFAKKVKIIHGVDWNFYKMLTEKLHWNRELF